MSVVFESVAARTEQLDDQQLPQQGTILVVDDSPVDAKLAAHIIQKRLGMKVEFAGNGVQALEALKKQLPAMVLTDLMMPEMDGLELVDAVCQRYPYLPIVLMTAKGSEDIAIQALKTGATSYIPKKVLHEKLSADLQRILAVSQVERRRQRFLEGLSHLEYSLSLRTDETLIPVFIQHVQEYLLRMGLCNENTRIRAGVAFEEAMLNGMHHGNLELSSTLKETGRDDYLRAALDRKTQSPYAERKLHVEIRVTPQDGRFVFRDEGPGFDLSKLPDPTDPENLTRPSGRGLLLIRMFMDEVSHNAKGNEITMIRRRR